MMIDIDNLTPEEKQQIKEQIIQGEAWESGACAMLQKLLDDGKITQEEHFQYLKENWL